MLSIIPALSAILSQPIALTGAVDPAGMPPVLRVMLSTADGASETVVFAPAPLAEFDDARVEVRGARGIEVSSTRALGVRAWRASSASLSLCATTCGGTVRGEIVDHRDGSVHRISERPLASIAAAKGRIPAAIPAERVEASPVACGVDDHTGSPHGAEAQPLADIVANSRNGADDGGVAGASCRRECVLLCDSDYLFFTAYGPAPANTTAAIVQTINTVDAVYEKHVGVSFATSAIVVRTDPATDPYAGLTAAGSVLDRARAEWTNTTLYERDLVHMFSGTGYSDGIAGVAWVGVVCSQYGVGMTRFADSWVMCHEVGHNFGAPHCADEPCDTMCGGCLVMGPNDKVIMTNHRNGVGCLSEDPSGEHPIPPDAQLDFFSVAGNSAGTELSVLANDTDYNCDALAIDSFTTTSARGGSVALAGEPGAQRLRYTPPAGFFGSDTFQYTLRDADGLTDDAEVRVTVTTGGRIVVGRVCEAVTQSLEQAIDFADPATGADIDVAPGRYGRVDFKGKPVRLRALEGPASTFIDADLGRAVTIVGASASGAVVEGFTIHDASSTEGGAILVDTATTTIANCRFVGTAATTRGGAIATKSATVIVRDSMFDRATAPIGGAIAAQAGSLTVERCDFFRCTATAGSGGGVYATGSGFVKILDSTSMLSTATGNGGAARFEGGMSAQVGQSALCGGTPNNLSGAYQSLGGNTISATCVACDAIAWRNAEDCDGDGVADHCARFDGAIQDANGDGWPDSCASRADLQIVFWPTSCGGNGNAYELVLPGAATNWLTAYNAANARGGKLVTITTQAEADFVFARLASNPAAWTGGQGPWLGLYKSSGIWRWVTLEPYAFTQWAPGEPNNSGDRARWWTADGAIRATWDDQPSTNTAVASIVEYALAQDCNANGSPDARDIALGLSTDANSDGVPDECAPACPADIDGSGTIDAADLAALLGAWNTAAGDLDGNGTTDAADLAALLGAWGACD
jgi:hypothetical protein